MISCSAAVQQLWDFLEGSVSSGDAARIEEHLNVCRRCCGELDFAQELRRLLAANSDVDLPPDVATRMTAFLESIEGA